MSLRSTHQLEYKTAKARVLKSYSRLQVDIRA